jgi:hypothetical protein
LGLTLVLDTELKSKHQQKRTSVATPYEFQPKQSEITRSQSFSCQKIDSEVNTVTVKLDEINLT